MVTILLLHLYHTIKTNIMKNTEIEKIHYDGQKFTKLGSYPSLQAAHAEHKHYEHQQTFEDIDEMDRSIPYIHLMEFRDGEHYNDLYFTWKKI